VTCVPVPNVAFGSKALFHECGEHFRFPPISGGRADIPISTRWANSRSRKALPMLLPSAKPLARLKNESRARARSSSTEEPRLETQNPTSVPSSHPGCIQTTRWRTTRRIVIKRSKTLVTCGKSRLPQKLPPSGWLVPLLKARNDWITGCGR
jgi:hypothetical protein